MASAAAAAAAASVALIPIVVPNHYTIHLPNSQTRSFDLTILQRLFLTLEVFLKLCSIFPAIIVLSMPQDSTSSILSNITSHVVLAVIVLNVIVLIVETTPNQRCHEITTEFSDNNAPKQNRYTPSSCTNPVCSNTYLCPGFEICAPVEDPTFAIVNEACVIFFTVDYCLRMLICPFMPARLCGIVSDDWDEEELDRAAAEKRDPRRDPECTWYFQLLYYFFSPMNLVDVVAIAPFYVYLADPESSTKLSFIRLLRLFRLFKLFKYFKGPLQVVQMALYDSGEVLVILAISFLIATIFFGFVIFNVEQGQFEVSNFTASQGYDYGAYVRTSKDDMGADISPFDCVATSIYWAVITITTVGYGDLFPLTREGRAVACFAAVVGIFVIALPVGVVGSNFTTEYEKYNSRVKEAKERALEELKAMQRANGSSSSLNGWQASQTISAIVAAAKISRKVSARGTILTRTGSGRETVGQGNTDHDDASFGISMDVRESTLINEIKSEAATDSPNDSPSSVDGLIGPGAGVDASFAGGTRFHPRPVFSPMTTLLADSDSSHSQWAEQGGQCGGGAKVRIAAAVKGFFSLPLGGAEQRAELEILLAECDAAREQRVRLQQLETTLRHILGESQRCLGGGT